jgi:L-threonylcarbamoyladenylate synthase
VIEMNLYDFKTKINENELNNCAIDLQKGKIGIFPTETVYGIGADATNEEAVKSIFIAKGRASDNPLIIHIANFDDLNDYIEKPNQIEQKLMEFMPGPITIVFKKKNTIPNIVTANLPTVCVRMPDNEIAKKLIEKTGHPIAAPSANISGKPSGTNINDIYDEFKDKVAFIIDGGPTKIGLESTVVKVENNVPIILRPGKITPEQIKEKCGCVKLSDNLFSPPKGKVESPGMKYRHYAPKTPCLLIYSENNNALIEEIKKHLTNKTSIIGCSENKDKFNNKYYSYGNKTDLNSISHNIFSLLREVDKDNADIIIIEGVKKEGLGYAIMNRLIRTCEFNYIEK